MNNKKKKKIYIFIFFIFVMNKVTKSERQFSDFLKKSYDIKVGQTIFLSDSCYFNEKIKWKFKENNIIHIDKLNMIHAKNEGQIDITARYKNNKDNKFEFKINVLPKNPIKFFFTKPNLCDNESKITFNVITFKNNVKKIKFMLKKKDNDKFNEYITENNYKNNMTLVWNCYIGKLEQGNYDIDIYLLENEIWENYHSCTLNVNKKEDTLSPKYISEKGIDFIIEQENFSSNAYLDIAKIATFGYGIVLYPGDIFFNNLTKLEALVILKNYLNNCYSAKIINNFLISNDILFSQNQFDALLSFSYNVGNSWLLNNNSKLRNIILDVKKCNPKFGIVKEITGYLNLRSSPNLDGEIINKLYKNDFINLLPFVDSKWYNVKTLSGDEGFCIKEFIKPIYSLDDIDKEKFINEFSIYHHVKNKCILGLLIRRFKEINIFFKSNYNNKSCNLKYLCEFGYEIPNCFIKQYKI